MVVSDGGSPGDSHPLTSISSFIPARLKNGDKWAHPGQSGPPLGTGSGSALT